MYSFLVTLNHTQVFEAKGLEFNDVLLWDFFKDSPADKEWRLLYSYWYFFIALYQREIHADR